MIDKFDAGRYAIAICAASALLAIGGCRSDDGSLPPVFAAVFGVENARSVPYHIGEVPDPVVGAKDKIVGDAANNPGQCIYRTPTDGRYRAPCPKGYAIGDAG